MAFTIHRTRRARVDEPTPTAAAVDAPIVDRRVYARPVGAALAGALALIVGAWGAIAVYVGPYFGFRPVDEAAWTGSLQNGLLHLLPGCVAAAAGLMLLAMGPARRTVRGGALFLPALM